MTDILRERLDVPSNWRGAKLASSDEWIHTLHVAEVDDLLQLWLTAHEQWADGDAFLQQGIPSKAGTRSDADDIAAVRQPAR